MGYDVFISYSHGGDDLLSARVQRGMSHFAKPWWRRRALNIFRDRTALSANPGLWSSITEAMDSSRFFLMLASPEAAKSEWCQREVEHWRARRGVDGLLVLLTSGEMAWDAARGDFDWTRTTALPPAFAGCFVEEPRHVDMRWARSETQLDLRNGRFRDQIAELAAPVHGVAKDEIANADVHEHRRTIRTAIGAGIALAFLTSASIALAIVAVNASSSARRNAAHARAEEHIAVLQAHRALTAQQAAQVRRREADQARLLALRRQRQAQHNAKVAAQQRALAQRNASDLAVANTDLAKTNDNLRTANTNLDRSGLALSKSDLLAEARLAARRSEQLTNAGDQTYQLGLVLAAEAVRHACASSAIDPSIPSSLQLAYPNPGCAQPGAPIDPAVASTGLSAVANVGQRYVTARLAGTAPVDTASPDRPAPYFDPVSWSSDGTRFTTFSQTQSGSPADVQVWNSSGQLVANTTSTAALMTDSALSGDGNVLAVSTDPTGTPAAVTAWSLASRRNVLGFQVAGRRPAVSSNGNTVAALSPRQARSIVIATASAPPRRVSLPGVPVDVAVNADGSLAATVVHQEVDQYEVVPIDVATGVAGRPVGLGSFASGVSTTWLNPPRVRGATTDPPATWFSPSGTLWVYNDEVHVGVRVGYGSAAPIARKTWVRRINQENFSLPVQASTPDGQSLVLAQSLGSGFGTTLFEVVTRQREGNWIASGLATLNLCASNACQLSISPNGSTLAVRSLSALQIIDLRASFMASSAIVVASRTPHDAVTVGPTGASAVRWSAHALVLLKIARHSYQRVAVPLEGSQQVSAVGFNPGGTETVALITRSGRCPCRLVTLDASTGQQLRDVALGATALDHRAVASVALNDASDTAAVTFDDHPDQLGGEHRAGLATYSVATGQPLQVHDDSALGLGDRMVSIPAFQPGTRVVALVATTSNGDVTGVLLDARTGVVVDRLALAAGSVTVGGNFLNSGYALRFSPDGRLLAWNRGGSVVIWSVASASRVPLTSQAVLTSSGSFDPTALAVTNDGAVVTVGYNFYGTTGGPNYEVPLIGDELGRSFRPLGVANFVAPSIVEQMAVAAPATGAITAVTVEDNSPRTVVDNYGALPQTLLQDLCTAASRTITVAEWQVYFPGEPYRPACTAATAVNPSGLSIDPNAAPVRQPASTAHVARPRPRLHESLASAPEPRMRAGGSASRSAALSIHLHRRSPSTRVRARTSVPTRARLPQRAEATSYRATTNSSRCFAERPFRASSLEIGCPAPHQLRVHPQ